VPGDTRSAETPPLPSSGGPASGPEEWAAILLRFLRDHVRRAGAKGVVIGLSGGVDSATVAALAVHALGKKQVLGVMLPAADSDPQDLADARLLCEHLGIDHLERTIAPIVEGLERALGSTPDPYVHGNAKARARMLFLYAEAQGRDRLVCGTGNKSELLVGYFTKYGDGGTDLLPIGDLYKSQVFELARHLGLPARIVDKPPSAGLHPGQTDEEDLGMSYARLDQILKGIELNRSPEAVARRSGMPLEAVLTVARMVHRSEHKRRPPLVPKLGARTIGIDWRRSVHWDHWPAVGAVEGAGRAGHYEDTGNDTTRAQPS